MKPYVKISKVRDPLNFDNVLGYRPVLVYMNRNGNRQTINMSRSIHSTGRLFCTAEDAKIEYDRATPKELVLDSSSPVISTDHIDEINELGLYRIV